MVWGICLILILLVAGIYVMISLGFNVISIPISLFVGGMATASPTSTMNDFLIGFLIAQATPLLVLIIAILKWIIIDIRKIKKRVNCNN